MPPHSSQPLRLIAAALAAILTMPSPAYALRVQNAQETGLEEDLSEQIGRFSDRTSAVNSSGLQVLVAAAGGPSAELRTGLEEPPHAARQPRGPEVPQPVGAQAEKILDALIEAKLRFVAGTSSPRRVSPQGFKEYQWYRAIATSFRNRRSVPIGSVQNRHLYLSNDGAATLLGVNATHFRRARQHARISRFFEAAFGGSAEGLASDDVARCAARVTTLRANHPWLAGLQLGSDPHRLVLEAAPAWRPETRSWATMPPEAVAHLVLKKLFDTVRQLTGAEDRLFHTGPGIFVKTPDGIIRFVRERAQQATSLNIRKDAAQQLVLSWSAAASLTDIPDNALYERGEPWRQRLTHTLEAAFVKPVTASADDPLADHRRIAHQLSTGYGIRGVRITEGGVVKEYDVPTLTHQFLRAVSTQLGEEGRLVRGGPPTTRTYHRHQIEDLLHLHHVADALPDEVVMNMRQRISDTYGTVVPPKRTEGLAYDLWSLAAKLQASGVTVEIADPTLATRTGLEEDGRRAAVPDVLTWLKTILPGTVAVEAVPATLRGTSPGDHYLVVAPPAVVQVESLLRSRAKEVLVQALVMGTVRWPLIGVGKSGEVDDYRREILRWARRWGLVIPCSIHSHNHGTLWPSREDFHLHGVDARAGGHREFVYGARTGRVVEYGVNPRRRRGVPSTIRAQIWRDGAVEPDVYRLSETVRTPLTALSARALHWPLQDPRVHRIEMDDWKGRWVRWDRAVTVASVLQEAGLVQPAGGPSTRLRTGLEEGGRDRPSDGPHAQLGERYIALHQWGLAEAQWTAALTSHEFSTPADAARYRFERAKARMARGNIRGAREDCEAILALNAPDDPHNGRVHYLLADASMAEGDDAVAETSWANAIRAFERQGLDSLREDSRRELARAYRELARLQWQRNDLDGAQRNALAAIAVDPKDVGACLVLAQVGLQLGQPGPARTFADAALTIAPGSVNAWLLRARADLALEEWRAAATAARRALALNPKKAYAHALLSQALARQGRSEEARTAHAQAVRYSKGPPRSRLAGGASTPLSTGLEEPEAEARERAIQEAVEGARRLREVADQWLKVTVAVVDFSESQKPLRLIFSDPATYWAIPLAAKAGIPTIVLVPNGLVWNRVRQLWYAVKPQTSAFTILIEPTAVLDRYTRGYHVYEVGPATDGWFIRLSKPFQMVGVAMPSPEVLEPALGATRDYFRFA